MLRVATRCEPSAEPVFNPTRYARLVLVLFVRGRISRRTRPKTVLAPQRFLRTDITLCTLYAAECLDELDGPVRGASVARKRNATPFPQYPRRLSNSHV